MFLNNAKRKLQKNVWFRVENSEKSNFFHLCLETCLEWKFLFLYSFLNNYRWTFETNSIFSKL